MLISIIRHKSNKPKLTNSHVYQVSYQRQVYTISNVGPKQVPIDFFKFLNVIYNINLFISI